MANFKCHVRIYVPVDSKGNILRGPDDLGHYDLQIDNNGADLNFNGLIFTNPVFSYVPFNNRGCVAMAGEANVPVSSCRLYYFDFEATPAKVTAFLNSMQNTYLDLNPAKIDWEKQIVWYYVKTGPFVKYNVESTNCFNATATWCSMLDNDILASIGATVSNYRDLAAWKMFDKYGSAWRRVK